MEISVVWIFDDNEHTLFAIVFIPNMVIFEVMLSWFNITQLLNGVSYGITLSCVLTQG